MRIEYKKRIKEAVEKHDGQKVADQINIDHNHGDITDVEYVQYLNEVCEHIPAYWKSNLRHRKDVRSWGDCLLDIKRGVKTENMFFKSLVKEVIIPAFGLSEDYGRYTMNKGRPWLDPKIVEKTADYQLRLEDRVVPCDVKFVKNPGIFTPKEEDLIFCIKNDVYMLAFWNDGVIDPAKSKFDRNRTSFAFISPKAMENICLDVRPQQYACMGYKMACRLYRDRKPSFDKYFEVHTWNTKSLTIPS